MTPDAAGPTGLELRRETGRLTAALTRALGPRHLDLAEDAAQEAMVRALRVWPISGTPDDPTGWLLAVARNVARDRLRRDRRRGPMRSPEDESDEVSAAGADLDASAVQASDRLQDEELAMVFMACHPALSLTSRVALTLKTVCGLTVPEIARALLAKPTTVGQRLSRARATLREAAVRFEVPGRDELHQRLDAVLEVLYLLFNEGYPGPRKCPGGSHRRPTVEPPPPGRPSRRLRRSASRLERRRPPLRSPGGHRPVADPPPQSPGGPGPGGGGEPRRVVGGVGRSTPSPGAGRLPLDPRRRRRPPDPQR